MVLSFCPVAMYNDDPGNEFESDALQLYDEYICRLARKTVPRYFSSLKIELDLEIDELAQRSRIKFWQALQRQPITSPKSYIRQIVYSECVDLTRQRKPHVQLHLLKDEDGELSQGSVLGAKGQESDNPEYILEQKEQLIERLTRIVKFVLEKLSPRQKEAALCSLKERVDHVDELRYVLRKYHINLDDIQWPETREERRLLQASGSLARRAIAKHMDINRSIY